VANNEWKQNVIEGFCVEWSMPMRFCICDNGKYLTKVSTETLNAQKPHPDHLALVVSIVFALSSMVGF